LIPFILKLPRSEQFSKIKTFLLGNGGLYQYFQQTKGIEQLRSNPWFNALQVKFAYAVTCHKAQGGQWKNVFIDQGYITDEMVNTEYLRWLYTAFTRPTEKLFPGNFSDRFLNKRMISLSGNITQESGPALTFHYSPMIFTRRRLRLLPSNSP
jgi:hypothetical protein